MLSKDTVLLIEGVVEYDDFRKQTKVRGNAVKSLVQVREQQAKSLTLSLNQQDFSSQDRRGFSQEFADLLQPGLGGPCPVCIDYHLQNTNGKLTLGANWSVSPSDELIQTLKNRFGNEKVFLQYN